VEEYRERIEALQEDFPLTEPARSLAKLRWGEFMARTEESKQF
jgi:hypothetical protein